MKFYLEVLVSFLRHHSVSYILGNFDNFGDRFGDNSGLFIFFSINGFL